MIRFLVTVASENEKGTIHEDVLETDSMVGATRILLTYKAKRGYKAFSWRVDEVEGMV